jgi:ATP-dependent RNA helicase DDX52/ROK1
MITSGNLIDSLIFVQSIERAEELYKALKVEGVKVGVVHSGKSKLKRDEMIEKFRRKEIWVLVVTDVLARGMDLNVKMVVNYG